MEQLALKFLKRGDERNDGKVFLQYNSSSQKERWITKEALRKIRDHDKQRAINRSGEMNEKRRCRYRISPEYREKLLKIAATQKKKRPDLCRLNTRRHKALKASLKHHESNREAERMVYKFAAQLTKDTGIIHEVDHIIPLKHGGFHHHENLQVLPKSVNASKRDNPFWRSVNYSDWTCVPVILWPKGFISSLWNSRT